MSSQANVAKQSQQRTGLVPGAVLILLAGKYRGKRVIYLKNFEDGTVLVTGPFKVNGVPLRRVNARYVIATKTSIDVSSVEVSKFQPEYFAKEKTTKKKSEKDFFGEGEKKEVKAERIEDQKSVDKALLSEIKKTPLLKQYLSKTFSLKHGDRPHAMVF